MNERERYEKLMQQPNAVFVFGSNLAGQHGGGAARAAYEKYGALWGVGEGPQGRSYAPPTIRVAVRLSIEQIDGRALAFKQYAHEHPEQVFVLTRVGCGIAGYTDAEIAPLFADAPANVIRPVEWT